MLIGNVADEALAATATESGTVRTCALEVSATDAPGEGAGLESVTVQELLALAVRLDDAHWRAEIRAGETSATEAVWEDPFSVAVRVAVSSEDSEPVLTVNDADEAPAARSRELGTESAGALLASATAAPAGTGLESDTVQDALEFAERLAGAHCRAEMRAGETSATEVVWEDSFRTAVMLTVSSEESDDVLMGKDAEAPPARTVADTGMSRAFEFDLSATVAPPDGAEGLIVSAHVEVADGPRVAGLQDRAVMPGGVMSEPAGIVMVPPVGERERGSPAADAPRALVTETAVVVAFGVRTKDTRATIPSRMGLALRPEAMQI